MVLGALRELSLNFVVYEINVLLFSLSIMRRYLGF
jgi:hypothetical protein